MNLSSKKGFTLMEIIITVIIIAALAGMAVPAYFNSVEQSRSNEALVTLNIIHMGEKIYFLDNGTFWGASGQTTGPGGINAILNVDLAANANLMYGNIAFQNVSAAGYTCTVTRTGGNNNKWFQNIWAQGPETLQQNQGGNF